MIRPPDANRRARIVRLACRDPIARSRPISSQTLDLIVLAAAVLALAAGLLTVLVDWRRRVNLWKQAPERLADSPREHGDAYMLVLALAVVVALGGAWRWQAGWTPLSTAFATYATLLVAHRAGWRAADVLGLLLGALTWVTIAGAWLPRTPANLWIGLALAGVHQVWLARFWVQQLDDGRPWTTTGRMIPIARGVSAALLPLQLGAIAYSLIATRESPLWAILIAAVLSGLHVQLFVSDLRDQRSATPVVRA